MHLLITRPENNSAQFKRQLEEMGHDVTDAPLLEVKPTQLDIDIEGVQALMATSRNAISAIAGNLKPALLDLPIFTVGPATAKLAKDAGFKTVIQGPGRGEELIGVITERCNRKDGAILHLAGDFLAFDPKPALAHSGFKYRQAVVYETEAAPALPDTVTSHIRAGAFDAVVLMSPRTSRVYLDLAEQAGITPAALNVTCLCLSQAVAEPMSRAGARDVRVAIQPNSEEMLALVGDLSSTSGG